VRDDATHETEGVSRAGARRTGKSDSGVSRSCHLSTTQRYMHLSPAATEAAIRLLDAADGGEIGETKAGRSELTLYLQGKNGGGGGSRTLSSELRERVRESR